MSPFNVLSGVAVPLMVANIDTDIIIRVERMTAKSADAMRQYAFEALRYDADGTVNPDCPLNQLPYAQAPILITGSNFGCGSSREPAVWAIASLGIRCIIAESFGDIFYGNCFQNGVLPITLPAGEIALLAREAALPADFKIDLPEQSITAPSGRVLRFDIDPVRKESLAFGLDEIDQTLTWAAEIKRWQQDDQSRRPWVWRLPASATMGCSVEHWLDHTHMNLN